jgi:hypothetical protein
MGARDERLALQRGAAQVLEQHARCARAVARRVADGRQRQRRHGREAQDGFGPGSGRAAVVE